MSTLHILNGDATAYSFEDTGLDGDVIFWREVLSEGPLTDNIASGSFWKAREQWMCSQFSETEGGYQQKVLDELAKLGDEVYEEINLWFEFDLHCQVNLLGIMNYLKQLSNLSMPAVFLICPADYPGKPDFKGMGELNGEELEFLYDNTRIQLSAMDFIIAEEAWNVYVLKDEEKLTSYLIDNSFWGSLTLLKPALEAQLKRLQLNEHGLNYVEQRLLDIYNSGIHTKPELYQEFWKIDKIYGMGDLEINSYLSRLEDKGLIQW